jgi:hypothetical protein
VLEIAIPPKLECSGENLEAKFHTTGHAKRYPFAVPVAGRGKIDCEIGSAEREPFIRTRGD